MCTTGEVTCCDQHMAFALQLLQLRRYYHHLCQARVHTAAANTFYVYHAKTT